MKDVKDTCIIEKGLPKIKYSLTDYMSSGARLYDSNTYKDLNKDFFTIDLKQLSLVELFEIDESLDLVLNNSTEVLDFEKEIGKEVDKDVFASLQTKINGIPHIYETPFNWDCLFVGYDNDLDLIEFDTKNELLVYSLNQNNKDFIFYISIYDFNCHCEYECYEFYGKDMINAKKILSEEMEINEDEIDENEIHFRVFPSSDDVYFFATNEQRKEIQDYYLKKFHLLREIFHTISPEIEDSVNSRIYLSQ